jgi:hypothetical protein
MFFILLDQFWRYHQASAINYLVVVIGNLLVEALVSIMLGTLAVDGVKLYYKVSIEAAFE